MSKLIIDPEDLPKLRALVAAKEAAGAKAAAEPMPSRVKTFWFHEEPTIPAWRLESATERGERHKTADVGLGRCVVAVMSTPST